MVTSFDISQEIFSIDMLTTLKSSLRHCRKHVLGSFRLYEDQAQDQFYELFKGEGTKLNQSVYIIKKLVTTTCFDRSSYLIDTDCSRNNAGASHWSAFSKATFVSLYINIFT